MIGLRKGKSLVTLIPFLGLAFSGECKEIQETKSPYQLLYPTFLGNAQRNFYGRGPVPEKLDIVWQLYVGGNKTRVGRKVRHWSGTGWTGQPVLVRANDRSYVVIGCLDYGLRKIDAETGEVIWKYSFDDVVKGTATIMSQQPAEGSEKLVILQGSRAGSSLSSKIVRSFRAIDFESGKELWSMNIRQTRSYSRDVDASPLVLDSLIFLGAENGIFYVINPYEIEFKEGFPQPEVVRELKLYDSKDIARHGGNLVIESSPVLCGDTIYVSAGSGHVYGIDRKTLNVVFDFYVGSDLDGTISVTEDNCLLVAVEKQYIEDRGGLLKLDPSKPDNCIVWYFPTEDTKVHSWQGGIVGSASFSDSLVAFHAIDGWLYLVNQNRFDGYATFNKQAHPKPKLLWKKHLGPSISTPLIVDNHIITCGYNNKLHVFKIDRREELNIAAVDSFTAPGSFESTPLVWQGKIYIGCRDGRLYCLGEVNERTEIPAN